MPRINKHVRWPEIDWGKQPIEVSGKNNVKLCDMERQSLLYQTCRDNVRAI